MEVTGLEDLPVSPALVGMVVQVVGDTMEAVEHMLLQVVVVPATLRTVSLVLPMLPTRAMGTRQSILSMLHPPISLPLLPFLLQPKPPPGHPPQSQRRYPRLHLHSLQLSNHPQALLSPPP